MSRLTPDEYAEYAASIYVEDDLNNLLCIECGQIPCACNLRG
jgi:hypothetical protein